MSVATAQPAVPEPGAADPDDGDVRRDAHRARFRQFGPLRQALTVLADLRIAVTVLGLGIFLVLAGTLAQTEVDIWAVVHGYFRCFLAWIPFRVFFPQAFFGTFGDKLSGGFWFPGGWTLGGIFLANLLASMSTKFHLRATGTRLAAGSAVFTLGAAATGLVILSGTGSGGFQSDPWLDWVVLWRVFAAGLWAVAVGLCVWLVRLLGAERSVRSTEVLVGMAAVIALTLAGWATLIEPVSAASMRILWQLMKATLAGLILLAGCRVLFKQQGGTLLLHIGVVLLLLSELHTGLTAKEFTVQLAEGERTNYVSDIRTAELAVVKEEGGEEVHAVVPVGRLDEGAVIDDPALPFTIEVLDFEPNAEVGRRESVEHPNPATAGLGELASLVPLGVSTGVDMNSRADTPGAYLKLTGKDGDDLGTWLFVTETLRPQTVTVGDTDYAVQLRFQRSYRPFTVALEDVSATMYPGTSTPRDFRSEVVIDDPRTGDGQRYSIWMNNPLRYDGETFYQSNYTSKEKGGGVERTGLSVVANTGWMIPYVACMLTVVGMLGQFLAGLDRFLARRAQSRTGTATTPGGRATSKLPAAMRRAAGVGGATDDVRVFEERPDPARAARYGWALPLLVVLVFGGYALSKARVPKPMANGVDLYAFGQIPVLHGGRPMPLDTYARNALKAISGNHQEFEVEVTVDDEEETEKRPALRWFLDLLADRDAAADYRVFRLDNLQVLALMDLEPRDGFRYSQREILPGLQALSKRATQILERQREAREAGTSLELDATERKILETQDLIGVVETLLVSFDEDERALDPARTPLALSPMQFYNMRYEALWAGGAPLAVPRGDREGTPRWETLAHAWQQERFEAEIAPILEEAGTPPAEFAERIAGNPADAPPTLRGIGEFITPAAFDGEDDPVVDEWVSLKRAYAADDGKAFNAAVIRLKQLLAERDPSLSTGRIRFEAFFNQFAPFFYSWVLYIAAAVLTCLSWVLVPLRADGPVRRSAFWLLAFTFGLHTFALAARVYISGRPPVTNLYSSAVFIGWAVALFGLVMETLLKRGIGNAVAASAGVLTLLIAHSTALSGKDTFQVMQAVLDTQFWLATHVVTITLGYAATYVAGSLGIIYVLAGVFTPALSGDVGDRRGRNLGQALASMIYGATCFAILLSFFGTVLGGLWADDSWGRFWGWDTKENGALIIVMWNALVLHARWGRLVGDRGLALLAIGGNIAVTWSWFGVNQLGVGLHSYGSNASVLLFLEVAVAGFLGLILLGVLVPQRLWVSSRRSA